MQPGGDLSIRGDEKAFRGGYRRIIAGFNKTLETITEPINEAMRLAGVMPLVTLPQV